MSGLFHLCNPPDVFLLPKARLKLRSTSNERLQSFVILPLSLCKPYYQTSEVYHMNVWKLNTFLIRDAVSEKRFAAAYIEYYLLMSVWFVTPCGFVGRYIDVSEEHIALHLRLQPSRGRSMFLWNVAYLPTSPHGVTVRKNNINIFRSLRTPVSKC
jgi:hypothetical protein